MRLRAYQPGEEPMLWDLYVRLGASGQDRQQWLARMQHSTPFVVEYAQQVIGTVNLDAEGVIDHFVVHASWQRRGVGTLLMQKIHRHAAEQRLDSLSALVCRTAQPFFARWGFVPAPEGARGDDHAWMYKHLV